MNARPQSGFILVDKPKGPSSFKVIEGIRRVYRDHYGLKRRELPKIGHAGTLDPFASGLLVILVGSASRLSKHFIQSDKGYVGEIEFGVRSESGDRTNEIVERTDIIPNDITMIQKQAVQFCHDIYHQTPPMHSAVKVDGKRLYELARKGETVAVESRPRKVFNFDINAYEKPKARFVTTVSSGTYIRVLAQDLAKKLGTVGILNSLTRVRSGTFPLDRAVGIDELEELIKKDRLYQSSAWVSLLEAVSEWESAELSQNETSAIINGNQSVLFSISKRLNSSKQSAALVHSQKLVATLEKNRDGLWKIDRVFC